MQQQPQHHDQQQPQQLIDQHQQHHNHHRMWWFFAFHNTTNPHAPNYSYYTLRSFLIRLLCLIVLLSATYYIQQYPYNPFSQHEQSQYTFLPEQLNLTIPISPNFSVIIKELNDSNWDAFVSYRKKPILLLLYAPSVRCVWSTQFMDTFSSLVRRIKTDSFAEIRNITIAKLDGYRNSALAFELGARGFPSLMLLEVPSSSISSSSLSNHTKHNHNHNHTQKQHNETASTSSRGMTHGDDDDNNNFNRRNNRDNGNNDMPMPTMNDMLSEMQERTTTTTYDDDTNEIRQREATAQKREEHEDEPSSQSSSPSSSFLDTQMVVDSDSGDTVRFNGLFIRKSILEEIEGFGGLTINKVNRNEYIEYKGRRTVNDIMKWLYKQILTAKNRRYYVQSFDRWNHILKDMSNDKHMLVLLYDESRLSQEARSLMINEFLKIKFIDTAKLEVNETNVDDMQRILDPYHIRIGQQSREQQEQQQELEDGDSSSSTSSGAVALMKPRVFLLLNPKANNDRDSKLYIEFELAPGLDERVISALNRMRDHQSPPSSAQRHDEL